MMIAAAQDRTCWVLPTRLAREVLLTPEGTVAFSKPCKASGKQQSTNIQNGINRNHPKAIVVSNGVFKCGWCFQILFATDLMELQASKNFLKIWSF